MIDTIITPRVSETDGVGHINNVFVPIWFEAGRRKIFSIFSPDLSFKKWKLALVNINVDYTDQLFLKDDVYIKTWIEKIGKTSFQIGERIEIYTAKALSSHLFCFCLPKVYFFLIVFIRKTSIFCAMNTPETITI